MYCSIDVKISSKTQNYFLVKAFSNPRLNYIFQTSVKGFIGVKCPSIFTNISSLLFKTKRTQTKFLTFPHV